MLLMCWTQYVRKFGKFINGHRTGKGQLSFQSQRKAMPKNVQTTVHRTPLPHTENFQVFWNLEKAKNQRSNCQHPLDQRKGKGIPEKHLLLLH